MSVNFPTGEDRTQRGHVHLHLGIMLRLRDASFEFEDTQPIWAIDDTIDPPTKEDGR